MGKHIHSTDFQRKEVFVVVDGISTGRHIAPSLRGNGYSVVHVCSKNAQSLGIEHNQHDYIANLKETDSIHDLVGSFSAFHVRAVIPGAEAGVELADQLGEALELPTRNDFSKTKARKSKFLMQETIREKGLLAANQTKTDNLFALLDWVNKNGLPVVLKPEESAGTDGVHFCYKLNDVIDAFGVIMGSDNIFKAKNKNVVAQEMLVGDEFMVNTVSFGEAISITDIIFVHKKVINGSPLYDYSTIIGPEDKRFQLISDYVKQVLPILGLNYGAAHTEVILTQKGPTLVEVNPRLTGAFDMSATNDAVGVNHVSVLVRAYTRNGYLEKRAGMDKPHQKHTLTSFFIAEKEGILINDPDLAPFRNIPGFHSIKFGYGKGGDLPKTTNLMNSPGMVNFVSKSMDKLLSAHGIFRKQEKQFFEEVLPAEESVANYKL
ncbi:hypothetical protein TUM19329_33130 [Legionella antarctica]|uniref:ATP-grasp domain-containing protein n=1 Tax=Legionella antarctica TaxID=2708020 RepID=A0A6F8TA65_9GAMM|nr:ATP-grasp domain-containing protein [Legionella antarctica]BCA96952.1 hypothetical protein TUM19329_33130 [Legionella antarctica]